MPLDSLVAPLAAFLAPATPLPPPVPQFHGRGEMRTTLYAGPRWMDDDFAPAEDHLLLGIALDVREPGGRASFEAGYFYSTGDGDSSIGANTVKVDSLVHELWMGGRWTFDPWESPLRPYVGVGFSLLKAEYSTESLGLEDSNSGWALGVYGHGGLAWEFGGGWAAGIDLRTLYSTPATLQREVPLDYLQAAFTVSWAW